MKFSEKLSQARKKAGLTQEELATIVGLTRKAVNNYEIGKTHPRTRDMYKKLADTLKLDVNYLLTEDEEFIAGASELYGSRGAKQAKLLIESAQGLFAGGELSDNDKDAVMRALQDAYWVAKEENVTKYTPKKFRLAKK